MGYGYYEINRFDTFKPMKRGYGVYCKCHQRGCKEQIDRGFGYLCYSCGWYYCGKHEGEAYCTTHDKPIVFECFAGESSQICKKCEKRIEAYYEKNECGQEHEID